MSDPYKNIPALSHNTDREPYPLSRMQKNKIWSLIRAECCNYDPCYGECLCPDGHDGTACIQLVDDHLVCRWMEHAVLLLDPALRAEIFKDPSRRHCARCGSWFLPGSGRALYCPTCASQVRKEHKKVSARKRRAKQVFSS